MKWSFATIGLVAAGLVGIVIILLFQNLTVNNEEDYYLLKEISEAAMVDAIDLAYYRDTGKLKIVQEKFVENFTRRFAEAANVLNTNNYFIEFYDIMEIPPKVSVKITTNIGEYTIFGNHLDTQSYGVSNYLNSIIERDEMEEKILCDKEIEYTSIPYVSADNSSYDNYTPVRVGDPSNWGYSGDWEVAMYAGNYDLNFVTALQTVGQVAGHDANFSKMYPEYDATGFETNADAKYFAIYQTDPIITLKYDQTRDAYYVDWKIEQYECIDKTDFFSFNGTVHENQCFLGIAYKIKWHNKQCD